MTPAPASPRPYTPAMQQWIADQIAKAEKKPKPQSES